MSGAIPDALAKAQNTTTSLVEKARKSIREMLLTPEGWKKFDRHVVEMLRIHAVEMPDSRALAEFLSKLTPSEFIKAEVAGKGVNALDASHELVKEARMIQIRATVIEAGLAEQMNADHSLRNASSFRAEALEKSLDEWLVRGHHRGAEYETAPLTLISQQIASFGTNGPVQQLESRFGLLIPIISTLHIWRTLEEFPAQIADQLGWVAKGAREPDAKSHPDDSAPMAS